MERQKDDEDNKGNEHESTKDSSPPFQMDIDLFAATTTDHIESECHTSVEILTNETEAYKLKLETTQKSLQDQSQQTNNLLEKYNSERTNSKELQREKKEALALVQEHRRQTETLAAHLEVEQAEHRELEETIHELENEIAIMRRRESQNNNNNNTTSCTLTTTIDEIDKLQLGIDEDVNQRNELNQKTIEFGIFKTTTRKHETEGQLTKEYQQQQQIRKEQPDASLIEYFGTMPLGENRSLIEEDIFIEENMLSTSKNEMQPIQNILRQSAMADKGPILPKVSPFGFDEMHGHREAIGVPHKVQDFTDSIKEAIKHNVKKIVEVRRRQVSNSFVKVDAPGIDRLERTRESIFSISTLAMKDIKSIGKATLRSTEKFVGKLAAPIQSKEFALLKENLKEEVSNAFGNIAQSIPHLVDNTKVITEKLKNSTDKVLKHGKEGSKIVRRQVKKNVDEVSIAGIGKLDRAQEVINVITGFALAELDSVGKRALVFADKWRQKRLQRSQQQVRVVNSNYYEGFVGTRKGGFDEQTNPYGWI